MTIWLLAILLFVAFGALGYVKGAVRMLFPLIGLFLGVVLAVPLSPVVQPLIPLLGMKNPVWSVLIPPVVVFFLISIVFIVIGFLVHRKISLHYKYGSDDYHRLSWERMNKRLGVCVGAVAGASYTLLVGLVIYILGYITVQVAAGDSDPAMVRYLNKARADLNSSGLEKVVAALDPTPDVYYKASDVLGLLYHNPLLSTRLASYPDLLALSERAEFQDLATDADYQNMLASRASVGQILGHEKTQAILGNQEIMGMLLALDLNDLYEYLQTGVSKKYEDQPILGRWELDPYATMIYQKRRRARMTSAEMRRMRQELGFMQGFVFVALPDETAKLKGPDISELVKTWLEAVAATASRSVPVVVQAQPQPQQGQDNSIYSTSPEMAARYGLNRGVERGVPTSGAPGSAPVLQQSVATQQARQAPQSAEAIAAEIAQLPPSTLAEGNWKDSAGQYEIAMRANKGILVLSPDESTLKIEAFLRDGKLYLRQDKETVVMARL